MYDKRLTAASAIFYTIVCCSIAYVILDGDLLNVLFSQPYYGYSVLLGFSAVFLVLLIIYRTRTLSPSFFLLISFIATPIVGVLGTEIYERLYGLFHGVGLEFSHPTFVWATGATALFAGILSAHYFIRTPGVNYCMRWNLTRATKLVWVTLGVSMLFSLYALMKIGYIPLLRANLGDVRAGFEAIVGDYPLKLSRLSLVAASLASMLAFLKKQKRVYFLVVLIACIALMIYGQRTYAITTIITFALIYCKFKRPRILYLVGAGSILVALLIFYSEFRGGRTYSELSFSEVLALQLFGEWREYSLVLNELHETGEFYQEKIFIGSISPILPKQIWALFGVDKNQLIHEYGAAFVFGRKFENELLGIRLGPIGEAYAGFGLFWGVCLQLFIFGLVFGTLEKIYLKLDKRDARLCIICFALALLMDLPVSTLYVILAHAVFFGFFFLVFLAWAGYRVREPAPPDTTALPGS